MTFCVTWSRVPIIHLLPVFITECFAIVIAAHICSYYLVNLLYAYYKKFYETVVRINYSIQRYTLKLS